jgi:outer membrane protein OmpA-like peptidoglycan-associated protein
MRNLKTLLMCGVLSAGLAAGACAPKTLVVLVPSPDGSTGKIGVSNAAGSVDIEKANTFTSIKDANSRPSAPAPMTEQEIHRLFDAALAATPPIPVHFLLFFDTDSTELRPESAARLDEIVALVRARGAELVSVVGHTDTAGDAAYNLALSTRRAQAVKNRLVAMGIAEGSMMVESHGATNLLVPTGPNVSEERNRRVEVVVR